MGTNHNILSSVIMKKGSESMLTKALENANEMQIQNDKEVSKGGSKVAQSNKTQGSK